MTKVETILNEAAVVLQQFMANPRNIAKIETAARMMTKSLRNGGKILSCGNGGSMSDAMHFAEELTGKFRNNRPSIPAIAISDPSYLSCVANDYGYTQIFSRYVEGVGREDDVLLGISTSGNSENVVNAVLSAKEKGIKTIVLTGKNGGQLAGLADLEIRVEHDGYADRIQEIHIKIIHILIQLIEEELFDKNNKSFE